MAKTRPSKKRVLLIISGIVILILCVFPVFYLTVYQWADSYVCPRIIAHRVGIEPTYLSIREYIQTTLTPGLDRNEVESRLARIGQVKVWKSDVILNDRKTDEIHLILCGDPMDYFIIFAHYSPAGKLIEIEFEGS
jgi:hypothetical protein